MTTTLRVSKKVASVVGVYCKLNNKKVQDYVSDVLSKEMEEFEAKLKELRKLKS